MNCFIIDDEPRALKILEAYISGTSFIQLKGSFRDPVMAMDAILTDKPDLIFLDINMPQISGLQLLKSLQHPPLVIFTTAYSEYAIDGYDLEVVDYLLKPIEFERFLKSATRARTLFDLKNAGQPDKVSANVKKEPEVIFLKSGTVTHRVDIQDILYVEGMGNYVQVVVPGKKIMVYTGLQKVLQILPAGSFMRVHKSYVVALKHIDTLELHQIKIGSQVIPVGKNYRSEVQERLYFL